jgi:hypothetical protein
LNSGNSAKTPAQTTPNRYIQQHGERQEQLQLAHSVAGQDGAGGQASAIAGRDAKSGRALARRRGIGRQFEGDEPGIAQQEAADHRDDEDKFGVSGAHGPASAQAQQNPGDHDRDDQRRIDHQGRQPLARPGHADTQVHALRRDQGTPVGAPVNGAHRLLLRGR